MIPHSKRLRARTSLMAGALAITLIAFGASHAKADTVAADVAANYSATGFTGNQGFGFGAWAVNTPGGGKYISNEATPAFGIWNTTANSATTALRPFASPLAVGQTFYVQLQLNNLDGVLNTNGFKLQDASGNTLFSYWHQGGDNADGHYSDALVTSGTATGFAYDYLQMDSFAFTLTSPTTYVFTDITKGTNFTGTLSGAPIAQVTFFRGNGNVTPSNGQDFKFNSLTITSQGQTNIGANLAYEGFDYSAGAISTQNGGNGWAAAWTNVAGNALYFDLDSLTGESNAPSQYDAHSSGHHLRGYGGSRVGRMLDCSSNGVFAANGYLNANGDIGAPGKTIYVSFLQQPAATTKFYEFEFHRNDYGDGGRIAGVGNDTAATNVNFRAPGNNHVSLGKGDTAVDFYVVRIDFHGGNDDVRVYRNPTSLTEPGVPTLTRLGTGDMSFDRFSVGVWDNFVAIDEIRVGAAWTNVIGLASAAPGSVDSIPLTNSMMIGQGIAAFVPTGYDSNEAPSMSLLSEPVSTGSLPLDWSLTPTFTLLNNKATASLSVPAGTSLYGGGEVAGPLLRNGQTIELWNTDTAGWSTDYLRRMYQAHPWVLGVRTNGTAFGVLFDSSYKATLTTADSRIVFKSHGPLFRVFVIDRATPQAVLQGLAELTGKMQMPPLWALGYHQSRFSYSPASQVQGIANGFLTNQMPCDTIWLDIGYMNNTRDFTINPSGFSNMPSLTTWLHTNGFHVVPILDPSIATDSSYFVYQSGTASNLWVQNASGQAFQANSSPGNAVWPDFTMPIARSWWGGLCKNFVTNGMDGLWIDMNEPQAGNALTALNSMPYDNWHRGGGGLTPGSHLKYRNAYGMLESLATRDALLAAYPNRRPFILTRASFIGGQRYAATWTGDNVSSTNNMLVSVPMSLTLGLSGQPFSGPDLGGFIANPTPDLWGSWVGFGAFFPFCRGHATAGTISKEPWAFGQTVENAARIALQRRYRLLPYIYTQFYQSSQTGIPVMQPVFFADPADLSLRSEQQSFLLGPDLLVTPCYAQSPAQPKGIWQPLSLVAGDNGKYQATLKIRGGAILPIGDVVQNSAQSLSNAFTLIVCLDANGSASGSSYRDAGDGWDFQSGNYKLQNFTAQQTGNSVLVQISNQQGSYPVANTPVNVQIITSNGTYYASGSLASGITVPVDARAGRAQTVFEAYNAAFYAVIDAGKAHYTVNTNPASGANYFWGQAEEIEGAIDAYERNPNPNYLGIATNLLNGFTSDNGTNWSGNTFNDDIMWACIAYLRGYQISGLTQYRSIAKFNFDLVYARGWDSVLGGGLYWTTAKAEKNACVNGPGAIASYLLNVTLTNTSYLTKAQGIYNWERAVLFNSANGAVYDNIKTNGTLETWSSTYNQGTFVGAADFLGDVTNATLAATYTMNNLGNPNGSGYNILFEYGANNNNSGFNGIGLRWIARFTQNQNLQFLYLPWLQANADAAWNMRRTSDNLSWCQWLHATPTTSNLLSWDCISSMVALQVVPASSNANAPVFTVQPANQVTAPGNSVGLSAVATNDQPIGYQWYHENNPIPGATGTNLILFSVAANDAGRYWVVATNSAASAYSQVATLYLIGNTNGLIAQDSATNYNTVTGFTGNQGFGFEPWVLSIIGGGSYINNGTPLFVIWGNTTNSQSTASRTFNLPMPVGSSFQVQLQFNNLDSGNKNGFRLQDANGNTLFGYWHTGNEANSNNGSYKDAVTGSGVAVNFQYAFSQLVTYKFTLTSPTNYTFADLATGASFNGKVSGAPIVQVVFFRTNGPGALSSGQDFKFTNLSITAPPATPTPALIAAENTAQGWSLHFPAAPGYSYRVQRATNLTGPWTDIGTLTGSAAGTGQFIDTNGPAPASFYRTVSP